jgi:twitching motility protein PilT
VHAPDFNSALVSSLRQDPDVILVGEIREKETIRTAIVAAETGHLVFATVHASDASGAIQRLTSVFPIDEQPGILRQLSMNLRAVLSQHLVPADGAAAMSQHLKEKRKRILLSEILQMTPATSNLVAKGQFQNLRSFMETGSKYGMQTLEENLFGWIQSGYLSQSSALSHTRNKKVLEQRINRGRDAVQKNRNYKPR